METQEEGDIIKVSDFKQFTSIWSLASLDDGSSFLTFEGGEAQLTVSFTGMHTAGTRLWPKTDVDIQGLDDDTPLSIPGVLLSGALGLMNESADLEASLSGNTLSLRAGGHLAKIRRIDSGSRWVMPEMVVQSSVEIDRAELGPKLDMLSGVASRTLDRPALTGINVSTASVQEEDRLVLRATDGHGRACLVMQSLRQLEGEFSFTAPAADITTALQECERIVKIEQGGGNLLISDEVTFVRLSLLHGAYPSFQSLPRKFDSRLIIPSSLIDTAVKAAKLLSNQRLVTLAARDRQLSLLVMDAELGDFEVKIGPTEEEDFEVHFDAEYLGQVASASGIETVLQRTHDGPAMVSGDGWYYWLTPVVKT